MANTGTKREASPHEIPHTGWQPIETAPRDGTPFLALNYDREVWPATYDEHNRLLFRHGQFLERTRATVHKVDGKRLLEMDDDYRDEKSGWVTNWTIWTRGYVFEPTHWMPLPEPPPR